MNQHNLRGLYAITPDTLDDEHLLIRAEAALRGGARILQFRDKHRPVGDRPGIARALQTLCRRFDTLFIINDDLPLALALGADGVHLGSDDGDLIAARQALGPERILGASCYANFELARQAVAAGADYVAFGAVFGSPTKPHAPRAPLALFERGQRELSVPSCAIGGITLENAPAVIAAGADMLAVITDLFDAPDIEARAGAYQSLFEGEPA
ncbi:thiamine phosphate synthase [Propionivibrio limicola]|uniref:thiamine phosphate synthase n=1 Tax=Propionivibrio limicola TaxID=167645 RepID=UPI001291A661|nr:thiamine phosphate synthase [Propionivibrio limicola]